MFQSSRTSVCSQYRAAPVREVRAGLVPGHCQRTPLQAKVLGKVDGEGPGLLQENARLGLRRTGHSASQDTYSPKRRTC